MTELEARREILLVIQNRVINNVSLSFIRYFDDQINVSNRLIILRDARGAGKTTWILQHYVKK